MAGQLIYIVGPSGSGKDSLIRLLTQEPDVIVMRRVVTRDADGVSEHSDCVTIEEFDQMEARGDFSMSWRANGLAYGISNTLEQCLAQNKMVIVNGSRKYCETLHQYYPQAIVVLLTVDASLLRQRLTQRKRESAFEIEQRLTRNALFENTLLHAFSQWKIRFFMLDNSHELVKTLQDFRAKLAYHLRIAKSDHMG